MIEERSTWLQTLLDQIERVNDVYSLHYQALSEFYQGIGRSQAPIVQFHAPRASMEWRPSMPVGDAISLAPFLLSASVVHATVMLASALEFYLYLMCRHVYIGNRTELDRTWFNLDMILPSSGVEPSLCARWGDVSRIFEVYYQFMHAEALANPEQAIATVNQADFLRFLNSVSAFAVDFESALIIQHPKMELP